jgi:hypothetical protein
MIDAKQIPDEVVDAADAALREYPDWDQRGLISAALAAALNAWEGAVHGHRKDDGTPFVKLPLPKEPRT